MTTILELLSRRASTRTFLDQPIPENVVHEILEAGRLSPSGGNEQPWRFGVITDKALIAEIAKLARQPWIAAAPLIIALCAVTVEDERGGRDIQTHRFPELKTQMESMDAGLYHALHMEEHQTKIAGAHMELAALERAVGCCWVSRFDVIGLAGLLELPQGIIPAELLVMGYPKTKKNPKDKKPLSEIAFFDRWK